MANANPTFISDPNQPYREWLRTQIYNPDAPSADAVYVPNVNDSVRDWAQGFFRVVGVDYTTGRSTLVAWDLPKSPQDDEIDVLLGAGPGTIADSYRFFVNAATNPATLSLDRRLRVNASTVSSFKLFKGTDISDEGQVISKYYDQNWNLLGENIPLEIVAMPDATNYAVKAPRVGYTTNLVQDGDLYTAVFYDDNAGPVSVAKLIAQNSSFIRTADASAKYITSISVESPFLNPADPTNFQIPINMPVQYVPMIGVVTYSDGSQKRLPVDGTKFRMAGLDSYIATQQGQRVGLVLIYNLSSNEFNYIGTPTPNGTITEEYSATTMPTDGAYSVKMFVTPVWQDPINGYRLQFWLYNLDRQDVYDVTSLVTAATDFAPFNPTLYNVVQNVAFGVQMNQVDPTFAPWRFVQSMAITLLRPGNDQGGDNWLIQYTPGQTPAYGVGTLAKGTFINTNLWNLDISCGLTDQTAWLDKVYYAGQPLYDSTSELKAPVPNFMRIIVNNTPYEFQVSQWNQVLQVSSQLVEGQAVYIQWIYRDGQNDLQLGSSGLIIHLNTAA